MSSEGTLPQVVMASANPDKVAEITALMVDVVEILPRPPEVGDIVEDADTLEGNARLKAVAICKATGKAAIADDTGLEIDHLNGAPGVYTARFAGEDATYQDNVDKTLEVLDGVPAEKRTARFRTVALLARSDGTELVAHGVIEGTIAETARGKGGFGYGPIFIPEGSDGLTFSEMTNDAKHAISHRGRAFRALKEQMR